MGEDFCNLIIEHRQLDAAMEQGKALIQSEDVREEREMFKYVVKRLLLGCVVLLGVITITFILCRVVPSDPVSKIVGTRATPEQRERARIELGLDQPLITQYAIYLKDLLNGDLGTSLRTKQPVVSELKEYIPSTVELVFMSMVIAIAIGIPLGIYSARKKDQLLDHFCRFFSVGAVSLPTFWTALFLQLIFYRVLNWLPLGGQVDVMVMLSNNVPKTTGFMLIDCLIAGNSTVFLDVLKHMILPAVTISLYPMGLVAKMTRASLVEVLSEEYIKSARSYGLKERLVMWKYALKNTLGTTVTVVATCIGYTLINTFLVEAIFSWPGLGTYVSSSVMNMDTPAIMGATLFSAVMYVILNLIADVIIAMDPRVRA